MPGVTSRLKKVRGPSQAPTPTPTTAFGKKANDSRSPRGRNAKLGVVVGILCLHLLWEMEVGREKSSLDGVEEIPNETHASTGLSWQSPHVLECKEFEGGVPTDDDIFVKTSTPSSFLMNIHDPSADAVSSAIHKDGCWECGHIKSMLTALNEHPNSYFLDVGGNIGMWTLSAAAANKQTFTIEPSMENYSRICKTVNKNGFHDRIHLMTIGASTEVATFQLHVPRGNKGGTSLVQAENNNELGEGTIKTLPIDSLDLPTDRPVVMKVDVEGHELKALLGGMEFLKKANLVYLAIELRPLHGGQGWEDVFKVLSDKGLKPFRLDPGVESSLDPTNLSQWKHHKHPKVLYYDVVWRMNDSVSSQGEKTR